MHRGAGEGLVCDGRAMSQSVDFVPHHALVTAPDVAPARWMLVLHGIFGSGANFRTIARRLAEAQPGPAAGSPPWGFILVDLRAHGLSLAPPPPHTVAAAAEDLLRLGDRLGLDIRGVMGHSFGGKVALAYMGMRPGAIERGIVLDVDPSASSKDHRDSTTAGVLDLLKSIPQPIPSRELFLETILAHGQSRGIAEWLAMNVRRADDGFRLRLDLDVMSQLLADYFAQDLWHVLETGFRPGLAGQSPEGSPGGGRLDFVIGGRSTTVSPASRARLDALAARAPWFSVHVLERAGHWLHVDEPESLLQVIRAVL
jgi:esterase